MAKLQMAKRETMRRPAVRVCVYGEIVWAWGSEMARESEVGGARQQILKSQYPGASSVAQAGYTTATWVESPQPARGCTVTRR